MNRLWLSLCGVSGFLAVCFGAFAAHGISDPAAKELLRTGSSYQFVHTLAALAAMAAAGAGYRCARFAPPFFLAGCLLFSGSLYALALGAPNIVGIITPFGGTAFLIGWGCMIWAGFAHKSPSPLAGEGGPRRGSDEGPR